jgi:hypothetical protein
MSDISLYLDQDNELKFNVAIEGSRLGSPKYRLVFEGGNFSYAFNGRALGGGDVSFTIPKMKNILKEGNYQADLEVVVDDRFFTPLSFNAGFEESVKVTAEAFTRPMAKKPVVSATIMTSKPTPSPAPIAEHAGNSRVARSPQKKLVLDENYAGEINGRKVTVDEIRALIKNWG